MLEVTGIAYPGGSGETIQQVEVSADEGRSWQLASLRNDEVLPDQSSKNWHWVRWHANLDVGEGTVAGEVWCMQGLDIIGAAASRLAQAWGLCLLRLAQSRLGRVR